eukprot:COSAG06_NODE_14684_length_1135_cov_1.520270_1_plen_95_part_10
MALLVVVILCQHVPVGVCVCVCVCETHATVVGFPACNVRPEPVLATLLRCVFTRQLLPAEKTRTREKKRPSFLSQKVTSWRRSQAIYVKKMIILP